MPKKKVNDVKAEIKKIVKKKKRKVYFGQEVQNAVIDYNTSTNDIERNKIYQTRILILVCWCIFRRGNTDEQKEHDSASRAHDR